MRSSNVSENSNHPLQSALEAQFPQLSGKIQVQDFTERIFVTLDLPEKGRTTLSTPHTVNAAVEPWQYWLARFSEQIRRRL